MIFDVQLNNKQYTREVLDMKRLSIFSIIIMICAGCTSAPKQTVNPQTGTAIFAERVRCSDALLERAAQNKDITSIECAQVCEDGQCAMSIIVGIFSGTVTISEMSDLDALPKVCTKRVCSSVGSCVSTPVFTSSYSSSVCVSECENDKGCPGEPLKRSG